MAQHNTEDVNAHFIDVGSNAPPKPTPYWLFTGSWDATNSYTKVRVRVRVRRVRVS